MRLTDAGSMARHATLYLRLALAAGFLTSVSDRFGLWGAPGRPNVAWGDFQRFTTYTSQLNPWVPAVLIPPLAWFVTAAETVLGFALILGLRTRYAALASGRSPGPLRVGNDGWHRIEGRAQLLSVRRIGRCVRPRNRPLARGSVPTHNSDTTVNRVTVAMSFIRQLKGLHHECKRECRRYARDLRRDRAQGCATRVRAL